jgi:hypothetical protein
LLAAVAVEVVTLEAVALEDTEPQQDLVLRLVLATQ